MRPKEKAPKPAAHDLRAVARRELGIELDKEHQKSDWGGELSSEMLRYAANDALVLLPLAGALGSKLRDAGLERVSEIEHRALPAMVRMANAGVPFDADGWRRHLETTVTQEIARLKGELDALAPPPPNGGAWNWGSPKQAKEALALAGLNLPNTAKKTLARCKHPVTRTLLEYRKASKLASAFGPKLLEFVREDGRIYADWRQIGARTGRMSCGKPNLQQTPKGREEEGEEGRLRRYVRAPEGRVLVRADYAQAEVRILAKASGDPTLLGAFGAGKDPYRATAAGMYGVPEGEVTKEQRSAAKGVVLSIVYGTTARGLAERLGTGVREARGLMDSFFAAHPKVEAYLDRTAEEALGTGEVRTPAGRRRRFGGAAALRGAKRRAVGRRAKNFPMQGSCADGTKLALALLLERRHECPGAVPIIALHDEVVVECDEGDAEKVKAWLEKAMIDGMDEVINGAGVEGPRVPIGVEVESGRTWAG